MSEELKKFERTGKFQNGIKISELIEHLEDTKILFGDQPIRFSLHGDPNDCIVQFDYYANALAIDVTDLEDSE